MREIIPFCKDIVFKTNIASITSISLEHEENILNGEVSGNFIIFGDYKIHSDTTEKEMFKYRLPFTALIPDNIEESSVIVDIDNFTYEQIENDVLKVNIDFSLEGTEKEVERVEILEETDDNEIVSEVPDNIEEIYEAIDNFVEMRRKEEEKETLENNEENIEDDVEDIECEQIESLDGIRINTINDEIKDVEIEEDRNDNNNVIVQNNMTLEVKEEKQNDNLEEKEIVTMEKVEKVEHSEYVTYHIHVVGNDETIDSILKRYGSSMDALKEYNDLSNVKIGDKVIIPEYLDE